MKKIAFSGTLDPITHGHMWVIGEARELADEVIVLISENPVKKPQFSSERRRAIVEASVAAQGWTNVSVVLVRGDYTARYAKRQGIDFLIRGIRNTSDFDYENLIQQVNVDVLHGAKTLFVMPPRDLGSVSSSFVRGLQGPVGWHWSTREFMPAPAYAAWIIDWLRKDWDGLWGSQAGSAATQQWFERLTGPAVYGAPGRPYHNLDHLVHGLTELGVWAANNGACEADTTVLKKAFWFHDAVYGEGSAAASDEELSARLWLGSGLDDAIVANEVAALIRATDHRDRPPQPHRLAGVMTSADLAILGQPQTIYDGYSKAVRAEYSHVADAAYRAGRGRILAQFRDLAQAGTLFADPYFATLYRDSALDNLEREIAALEAAIT